MKDTIITQANVKKLNAELFMPFTISSGSHSSLANVAVELKTAGGICGYGEAAVATHITGETVEQTEANLKAVCSELIGLDSANYLKILHSLEERLEKNRAAMAGLELAVLDLMCRQQGISLWKYYGGTEKEVRTDITVVIGSEAKAREFMLKTKDRFRDFKIKVGIDYDEDIKRLIAVHELAPNAKLIVDANCAYTPENAEKFFNDLIKRGIRPDCVEQPVKKDDFDGLKYLTEKLPLAICADESAYSLDDVFALIRRRCIKAVNIKLTKLGFIRAREVWALAKANGIKLMMGEMMESELSSFAAAEMAGGLGGFDFIDLDTPFFLKNSPCPAGDLLADNGTYRLSAVKAGTGIVPGIF
ncbi:MAG: dipeptide epimerase [Elusimicrobiales bacterium]|nr:dipeptide epimerase [Elusimicrobiales bacterium]